MKAFVGGGNVGGLYSLQPGRPAEELLSLETIDFFTGASFLGSGHVLVTVEEPIRAEFGYVKFHVIGGAPLAELACQVSHGTLADTVAEELLSPAQLVELEC